MSNPVPDIRIGASPDHMYVNMAGALEIYGKEILSRNGLTKEIHPAFYGANNFDRYMLTVKGRVYNLPFQLAELVWIMTGDDGDWISAYNKQMGAYVNEDEDTGRLYHNAAYGKRIFYAHGIDQFEDVIKHLKDNHESRHAGMVMRHPELDRKRGLYHIGAVDVKDRACNIASLFLIRDGKLHLTQMVRSHDFIWGLPSNLIQFGYITQAIAERLEVPVGSCYWTSQSFHVYEKFFGDLNDIKLQTVNLPTGKLSPPAIGSIDYKVVRDLMQRWRRKDDDQWAPRGKKSGDLSSELSYIDDATNESPFWHSALRVILANHLRGNMGLAWDVFISIESDLFKLLLLRYWVHRIKAHRVAFADEDSMLRQNMKLHFNENNDFVVRWLR